MKIILVVFLVACVATVLVQAKHHRHKSEKSSHEDEAHTPAPAPSDDGSSSAGETMPTVEEVMNYPVPSSFLEGMDDKGKHGSTPTGGKHGKHGKSRRHG